MDGVSSLRHMVVEFESNCPCESVLGGERSLLGGREVVARYRDRLRGAGEGVPDDGLVLVRDEEHPDRGLVLRSAQPILDQRDVEAELAGITRVEPGGLEFDDHIPELFDVEEQQIDEEVVALDIEVDLTTDEREPGAELTQSVDDALDEPILELALGGVPVDGEELERERILGDLLSQLGVWAFESARKVRRGRPLPRVQVRLDLVSQDGTLLPQGAVFCRSMIVAPICQ